MTETAAQAKERKAAEAKAAEQAEQERVAAAERQANEDAAAKAEQETADAERKASLDAAEQSGYERGLADAETARHAATIAPAQYSAETGWKVGQLAPSDQYVEVDHQGAPVGKPSSKPVEGKPANLVVVKGDVLTASQLAQLGKS